VPSPSKGERAQPATAVDQSSCSRAAGSIFPSHNPVEAVPCAFSPQQRCHPDGIAASFVGAPDILTDSHRSGCAVGLRGDCFIAQAGSGLALPVTHRGPLTRNRGTPPQELHGEDWGLGKRRSVRGETRAYDAGGGKIMNIFYIIGVVVVILFVLGYLGLR
jgi:hypothetical protein